MDPAMSPLKSQLEKLECHFTWALDYSSHKLQSLRDVLENINQEDCTWLDHLLNLLGYILHALGSTDEALLNLRKAEEVIRERGPEGLGPRLLVNQANLAWVHYHLGELPASQACLKEVARLREASPAPPECTLHPEVSGEKGWTLEKFQTIYKKRAIECFKMAVRGDPGRSEWQTGLAQAMYEAYRGSEITPETQSQTLVELNRAKELDPDNKYLASIYLIKLAETSREVTKENVSEAHELADSLISRGNIAELNGVLHFLRVYVSVDSAIDVAERAVETYPTSIDAKQQLLLCYKRKVFSMTQDSEEKQDLLRRAIPVYEEVTSLFPHYLRGKLDFAAMSVQSHNVSRADQIYEELLANVANLEPAGLQLLYHRYGKYLNFHKRSRSESIDYHKKAAEIPNSSEERDNSIRILTSIIKRERPRWREIQDFLDHLELKP